MATHPGPRPANPSHPPEYPMLEFTPANSTYEEDPERLSRCIIPGRVVLRALNSTLHAGACAVLISVMAEFLIRAHMPRFRPMVPEAATITSLLLLDVCLDVLSIARFRESWPGLAVLVRLICGIGYVILFMIYVGLRRVFPSGYTYWGIPEAFAEPVVYLFLWLIGVWDLLHTALHRYHLGHGLPMYRHPVRPRGGGVHRWAVDPERILRAFVGRPRSRRRGSTARVGGGMTHNAQRANSAPTEGTAAVPLPRLATNNATDNILLPSRQGDSKTDSTASSEGSRTDEASSPEQREAPSAGGSETRL